MTKFITIKQAVDDYGIPEKVIREAVKRYELPCYKPAGRTKYLKPYEIDIWINSKKVEPTPLFRFKEYLENKSN